MKAVSTALSAPENIADKRVELLAKREELQRQRGASLLDGKKFDGAKLTIIDADLAGLDDVEAEVSRRRAAAAVAAAQAQETLVARNVAQLDEDRMLALADAQQAADQMVQAFSRFRESSLGIIQELFTLGRDRSRAASPQSLLKDELDKRISVMIIGALQPIKSRNVSLGLIEWSQPGAAIDDWPNFESTAASPDVEAIFQRNKST